MKAILPEYTSKLTGLVMKSLARHRLVFVQLGAVFEPVRESICTNLDGVCVTVDQREDWEELSASARTLVVTDMEKCAESAAYALGEVRASIFSLMDSGKTICLFSRIPRMSFRLVPGSSVLEDAALVSLPLLDRSDLMVESDDRPCQGWQWPSVTFGAPLTVESFRDALADLGQGLVAALDHALFEISPKGTEGLGFLAPRELEGLRGGGILAIDGAGRPSIAVAGSAKLLREALATHISESVLPEPTLPEISSGLWYIERKIRNAVRAAAISKFGNDWHASSLGGMRDEVLRRAQLDTNVTAKTVGDLRDPLEWLTLGELMDIVRSPKFDNLGIEPAVWRKLQEQLVPIRNRLAHVRMLKADDAEIVTMWESLVKARFGSRPRHSTSIGP